MKYDYSVSWNEVKQVVDELIDDHDKKMAMGDIGFLVDKAWGILHDNMDKLYDELT